MASLKTVFKEEQKFTQIWLWILLVLVFLSPFIININSIINKGFEGTFSKGIFAHIITIGGGLLLFGVMKLKTEVNDQKIKIHYVPFFLKKEINWAEVTQAEIVNYKFSEVLGWGIRLWTTYGTVYNVKGTQGAFLKLKDGSKYMIGTQKPKEFEKIIDQLNKKA